MLSFTQAGNRLTSLQSWNGLELPEMATFTYDAMGNQFSDNRKGLQFCYNFANLPSRVEGVAGSAGAGLTLSYGYLSDGAKTSATDCSVSVGSNPEGLRYRGAFIYELKDGSERISSIAWRDGRISFDYSQNASSPQMRDEWHVKDHLGNVRVVHSLEPNGGAVLEVNEYLPFGGSLSSSIVSPPELNRYRLGGKEEQRFGSVDIHLSDFGARYYDSFTCRWNAVDPLAQKYFVMSPYNYCGNNPVNYYDAQGDSLTVKDMATLEAIYNGIQPGTNVTLVFNNGVLDPSSIPDNSGDFFPDDLKEIACDKRMVEMETSPSYSCILVSTGERDFIEFGTPKDEDDNDFPDYVAYCKEYGEPYGKHIVGNLGRSLFPASTESISVDGKIHVIINSKGTLNQRTVGAAHEFAHVLLYFRGLPYQHWQTVESDAFISNKASGMSKRLGYDY
ncbi:MAG: hypothetical protein IKZ72_05925 [Bacteroidales bacterium]|nr:hypothetical protein [Bacteroidales bacterium]